MKITFPKDDAKYRWTNHVKRKMAYYGLSGDRIKRIIRNPSRAQTGVAENTIAVMQSTGTKKKPTEVWAMYSLSKKASMVSLSNPSKGSGRKIIITAWRYPAISPVRDQIPIPADILAELKEEGVFK